MWFPVRDNISTHIFNEGRKISYAVIAHNLSTHSYTVQYVISMEGRIMGKAFVCLQEKGGKLGPRVTAEVDEYLPPNIALTCSSSGKMSTSLNEYFIEHQIVLIL